MTAEDLVRADSTTVIREVGNFCVFGERESPQ